MCKCQRYLRRTLIMKHFDTKIQKIKYELLKSVIGYSFSGNLKQGCSDIIDNIENLPAESISSCCIYKEQAVMRERLKLLCGNSNNKNVINIIKPACTGCSSGGYIITDTCRNCISHRCASVCDNNAIFFTPDGKAVINRNKCSECGKCQRECQYNAIIFLKRPCENSCALKAISINDRKIAVINPDKCISCGQCINSCPDGAVDEISFITEAIEIIKKSEHNKRYRVYAVADPSFITQYPECSCGQFFSALKKAGFENAFSYAEDLRNSLDIQAGELVDNGLVISNFCPAFIRYLKINFPNMQKNISSAVSAVISAASSIKINDRNAKVIFIAPCSARKQEFYQNDMIDSVISFNELDALFEYLDISPYDMNDNHDYYSQHFISESSEKCFISGNISAVLDEAVAQKGFNHLKYRSAVCDNIDECRTALLKNSKKITVNTFIDGCVCSGGCGNGSGCINMNLSKKEHS